MANSELACTYAALPLILQDDDLSITPDKLSTILKAANVDVDPFWPGLFAKALDGVDVKNLITNISSGVGVPAAGGAAPTAAGGGGGEAPAEEKKEEAKKEESDSEDEDMGLGLFD